MDSFLYDKDLRHEEANDWVVNFGKPYFKLGKRSLMLYCIQLTENITLNDKNVGK